MEEPPLLRTFDSETEKARICRPSETDLPYRKYPNTFGKNYQLPQHRNKYLASVNPIPYFDDNITFYEEEHGYICFNRVASASVSGVLKPYLKPFDSTQTILRMQKKHWPRYKYSIGLQLVNDDNPVSNDEHVIVHNFETNETSFSGKYSDIQSLKAAEKVFTFERPMTDKEIMETWDSPEARNLGTEGHLMMENFFNGEVIYDTPEVISGLKFVKNQMAKIGAVGKRCELEIYGPEEDLAGSIDFLGYSPTTGEHYIFDWKRAKHLQKFKAYNNIKFFCHIPENDVGKYSFQLGIYTYIIQKYTDMKISGLALVSILPDTDWWTWCPYLKHEIEYLMRKRREVVAARLVVAHHCPELPRCCHSKEIAYDAVVDEDNNTWNKRVHDLLGKTNCEPDYKTRNMIMQKINSVGNVNTPNEEKNMVLVKSFVHMMPMSGVREYKSCHEF